MTNIVGISALFHDSACCLLQEGVLVAAAEEERFSRRKHDPDMPKRAFNYCLAAGALTIADVDCVAFYEQPSRKLARQLWTMLPDFTADSKVLSRLDAARPAREIREVLGFEGPIEFVEHHYAHAASSFFFSGFSDAAILTVDGVGEWATTTYGVGHENDILIFETVDFPDSLGLVYSTITNYLGFSVNDAEYKIMGAAAYGLPKYQKQIRTMVQSHAAGQYSLDLKYFDFRSLDRMYSDDLPELFGAPPRNRGAEVTQFHKDLARSIQFVLEEILLEKAEYLHKTTGSENLCMAGGVALNCVANSRILREGPFRKLFVQPAASDAGSSLGAAAIVARRTSGRDLKPAALNHAYLGPQFGSDEIISLLRAMGLKATDCRGKEPDLIAAVVHQLGQGKVVGWFHGRMEFGPRALGARSILADPRIDGMRDKINAQVKRRESFRPFAPAVLETKAHEHFDLDHPSPFMTETCRVTSRLHLPAITHVDGSARVQTVDADSSPRFASLLNAFERRTGCPILLNTSFNLSDEPIVCSPLDAIVCFIRSELDLLVLEDFIIDRSALGTAAQALLHDARVADHSAVRHSTYTLF